MYERQRSPPQALPRDQRRQRHPKNWLRDGDAVSNVKVNQFTSTITIQLETNLTGAIQD